MKAEIKFSKSGMLTTLQDHGRLNLQDIGISKGGASCPSLLEMGNALVENINQWSFEFVYNGPEIEVLEGFIAVSITGNVNFHILKDKKEIKGECYRSYILNQGDKLLIKNTINSVYGYVSIGGEVQLDKVFDSLSCNPRSKIGPGDGAKIQDGDTFYIKHNNEKNLYKLNRIPEKQLNNKVRILEGPQYDFFDKKSIKNFFNTPYEITTTSDKMGMRLSGSKIENLQSANIKSEAIIKGAIQVPADGQPIILLTDHQTIGGYPKIGVVASADFENLIQMPPKTHVSFRKINLKEAKISLALKEQTLKNILNSKTSINE